MSDWKAKRFWTDVTVEQVDGGFAVLLDGRSVRTPAKAPLVLPTHALADIVAAEWRAQDGEIDPTTMPATRGANAAIDKVSVNRDAVANMLSDYGDSDLICYRADSPAGLVTRQAEQWDPLVAWVQDTYGVTLKVVVGVMHVPQDPATLAALRADMDALDSFALSAFHDLVAMSGSLVIALVVAKGHLDAIKAWRLSRIDEDWQAEQWGADDEAVAAESVKRAAFLDADRFLKASLT